MKKLGRHFSVHCVHLFTIGFCEKMCNVQIIIGATVFDFVQLQSVIIPFGSSLTGILSTKSARIHGPHRILRGGGHNAVGRSGHLQDKEAFYIPTWNAVSVLFTYYPITKSMSNIFFLLEV